MTGKSDVVITTISGPNEVLRTYADGCLKHGMGLIVIGDRKSPANFELPGCRYLSIDEQLKLDFSLPRMLRENHYGRKNIGYLLAMRRGVEVIIETDDDNFPKEHFWRERATGKEALALNSKGWINVYRLFSERNIWPRGFPLEQLPRKMPGRQELETDYVVCPIQQGLCDGNPDVDAVYRLVMELPVEFEPSENVALGHGSWCPFNSQNTTWFKECFPLLYLPSYCSFRMTDIWRSFVAQRVAWTCGWHILFHKATVFQDRNTHDLLKDFEDEIPGYLGNARICRELEDLNLKEGREHIVQNLVRCYEMLVAQKHVDTRELDLLDCWVKDLIQMGFD